MNYEAIKKGLADYNPAEVEVFIEYLKHLETDTKSNKQLRNPWFKYFKPEEAIFLYKKVALDPGLFIDGKEITLQFKGKVMVSYNYQAYKNKLLGVYPETLFDLQNVFEGDTFSFRKKDGHVIYTHNFGDPFRLKKDASGKLQGRKPIGAYCIIKNKRGEFIETINQDDIAKMKAVAKTHDIWDKWEGEMWLKSVIKRACKRHFNDLVTNIETLDNENYDLEAPLVDPKIRQRIEGAESEEELKLIYEDHIFDFDDETGFLTLLTERKNELRKITQA